MADDIRDGVCPDSLEGLREPVGSAEHSKLIGKLGIGPIAVGVFREQAQRIVGEALRGSAHRVVVPRLRLKPILQLGG